jgi:hypothetical protein
VFTWGTGVQTLVLKNLTTLVLKNLTTIFRLTKEIFFIFNDNRARRGSNSIVFQINFCSISSNHFLPYEVKSFVGIRQRKEDFKEKQAGLPKKEFWKKNFRQTAFCFYIVFANSFCNRKLLTNHLSLMEGEGGTDE